MSESEIPRDLLPLYQANSGKRFMHERIIRQLVERAGKAEAQLAAKDAVIYKLTEQLEAKEAIEREQDSVLFGAGPILCRNMKEHSRFTDKNGVPVVVNGGIDDCVYCVIEKLVRALRDITDERSIGVAHVLAENALALAAPKEGQ